MMRIVSFLFVILSVGCSFVTTGCGKYETGKHYCEDGFKSGDETDVDCGGSCAGCVNGKACLSNDDCESDYCDKGLCHVKDLTCHDGKLSGDETDVDCGGFLCEPCANGFGCLLDSDCENRVCAFGYCRVQTFAGEDVDEDGLDDNVDNCPFTANRDQADTDEDGVGDACDNCPNFMNSDQKDMDGDMIGDHCDQNRDGDPKNNINEYCPNVPSLEPRDMDADNIGDACDPDIDGDGFLNEEDNCPTRFNPQQDENDPERFGDECNRDLDRDDVPVRKCSQ